ncbi:MAG: flagellar basal body L-ring protein FlgH [bacterium]
MRNLIGLALLAPALVWSSHPLLAQDFERFKQNSLYTDFKAKTVGDIITILIIESTSGTQQSDSKMTEKGSIKASGSLTGNLTRFLPLFTAQTDFESDNSGKADALQKDALTGKITAIVTEIAPNGNLTLQGRRRLEVNGEAYLLQVKGMARQKDITSDNIIFSYSLANVEISYKKAGLMNKLGKPSVVARWTTWMVMAGMTASAYLLLGVMSN